MAERCIGCFKNININIIQEEFEERIYIVKVQ